MPEIAFEWDEDKAKANLAKHGVSFLTASEIFVNERIGRVDDREDHGELSSDCPRSRRVEHLPSGVYKTQRASDKDHQRAKGSEA